MSVSAAVVGENLSFKNRVSTGLGETSRGCHLESSERRGLERGVVAMGPSIKKNKKDHMKE